jgi:hypothetical protein
MRLTKVSLAAQYSDTVVCGAKCWSACTKPAWPLADTVTPAVRRRATIAAAKAARSMPRNSNGAFTSVGAAPRSAPARRAVPPQRHRTS